MTWSGLLKKREVWLGLVSCMTYSSEMNEYHYRFPLYGMVVRYEDFNVKQMWPSIISQLQKF